MHVHANVQATQVRIMARAPSPGFTLLELMIAVAIIAVLAALAAPSLSDFFDRNRVRAAADDVASLISQARAEAVKNDLPVLVSTTGSGANWCVGANAADPPTPGEKASTTANTCDCTDGTECMVAGIRRVVSSADYRDVTISAAAGDFQFDNTLGAMVAGTGIDGTLGNQTMTLTSPTGKYDVRVEVPALGQARACTPPASPVLSGMSQCPN
jgi:prepilin-type N-terminal cleavage/methylation domain-containing protein